MTTIVKWVQCDVFIRHKRVTINTTWTLQSSSGALFIFLSSLAKVELFSRTMDDMLCTGVMGLIYHPLSRDAKQRMKGTNRVLPNVALKILRGVVILLDFLSIVYYLQRVCKSLIVFLKFSSLEHLCL